MTTIFREAKASNFDVVYPLVFSKGNLQQHKKEVTDDETKEHLFNKLSRVYIIKS
jgi:hypothetical protein